MSSRTILIDTEPDGSFAYERPCFSAVLGVKAVVGDLDAADIVVTDAETGDTIATFTGLTDDEFFQPDPYIVCSGTLRVEVTNGGDTKHGSVRLLLWG